MASADGAIHDHRHFMTRCVDDIAAWAGHYEWIDDLGFSRDRLDQLSVDFSDPKGRAALRPL